jgi:hypothetical protein
MSLFLDKCDLTPLILFCACSRRQLVDQELKAMLSLLLGKVDVLNDKFDGLNGRVDGLSDRVDGLSFEVSGIKEILPTLATKDDVARLETEVDSIKGILPTLATKGDIARLEREQASLKQVFGMTHQVMVGRVEQLTRQYEYLVGVRPKTAAE